MTQIKDNNILIPISQENQKYVESVCVNGAYTFQSFFEHLIVLYKKSLNEPLRLSEEEEPEQKKEEKKKKK